MNRKYRNEKLILFSTMEEIQNLLVNFPFLNKDIEYEKEWDLLHPYASAIFDTSQWRFIDMNLLCVSNKIENYPNEMEEQMKLKEQGLNILNLQIMKEDKEMKAVLGQWMLLLKSILVTHGKMFEKLKSLLEAVKSHSEITNVLKSFHGNYSSIKCL